MNLNLLLFSFCLLAFVITSCKSKEEQNKEKLTLAIREYIENEAFRANKPVKLLDISSLSYKIIGQSRIDSNRLNYYSNRQIHYGDLQIETMHLSNSKLRLAVLSKETNMNTIAEIYIEEAEKYNKQANGYRDSVSHYKALDSLLRLQMAKLPSNDKSFFHTTCYVKATIGDENMLDTLHLVIDKDFHVLK